MKMKRLIGAAVLAFGVLGAGAVTYASGVGSPAEIVADLTGQPVEAVVEQRATGTTYGAIAADAGLQAEFQQRMLELKKRILDERVAAGQITQEQADQIYQRMQENIGSCTGTGSGAGFGNCGLGGQGAGLGCGSAGAGNGQGAGLGRGMMRRQGVAGYGRTR